jgi:hypothetical protein
MAEMYPAKAKSGWTFPKRGGGFVLWREGSYFHDRQLAVTYTHKKGLWDGPVPTYAGDKLPNTLRKLKQGLPVKIVLYGDSIAQGGNASGFTGVPPHMPAFGELFVEYLRSVYASSISVDNTAVGGKNSAWGVANSHDRVAAREPDLVVLAFGMNDGTAGVTPDQFLKSFCCGKQMGLKRKGASAFL